VTDVVRITLRRLERYRKVHGILGSLRIGLSSAFWGRFRPSRRRKRALRAEREKQVDQKFGAGVDTTGSIPVSDLLDVQSEHWVHGVAYEPIQISSIADFLDPLALDYASTVFVDLGSGKGRAVLLACSLPFRKVVGVEFSPGLNLVAKENVQRYQGRRCDTELICADAAAYRLPDEPLVIFMNNPFRRPVMQKVVANIVASYRDLPRRIVVLYFRPECTELLDAIPFLKRVATLEPWQAHGGLHVYDSQPVDAGFSTA
jgi:SAM-dependent methyltransferase